MRNGRILRISGMFQDVESSYRRRRTVLELLEILPPLDTSSFQSDERDIQNVSQSKSSIFVHAEIKLACSDKILEVSCSIQSDESDIQNVSQSKSSIFVHAEIKLDCSDKILEVSCSIYRTNYLRKTQYLLKGSHNIY